MLLRLDSADRKDIVTDMAVLVVHDGGLQALTLRGIAARARMSPGGLINMFGSRKHLFLVVTTVFGGRWVGWIRQREHQGVAALLPVLPEELIGVRFALAMDELGRSSEDLGVRWGNSRRREREILQHRLAQRLGGPVDQATLDGVAAMIHGLRTALCAPGTPLSLGQAHAALEAQLERIGSQA